MSNRIHFFLFIHLFLSTTVIMHSLLIENFNVPPLYRMLAKANKYVINDKKMDLVVCEDSENGICQRVEKFTLADNATLHCNDKNLAIDFSVVDYLTNKSVDSFGYIPQDGPVISKKRELSKTCQKIKR